MSDIFLAKQRLPLPALMHRLGLGEHAKKSARCPFHDDKHNSFSVYKNGSGEFRFKCFAGCGEGDEINFLELHENLSRRDAVKRYLEMAGVNAATPHSALTPAFDWQKCNAAFTEKHVEQLASWRKFSPEFVRELRDNGQIGIYNGLVAFPVSNDNKVVGTHFRLKSGKWNYEPQGINSAPLIFGELVPGERVQCFESTWDGLDYLDKSGERCGVVITRGSGNTKFVTALIPRNCTLYLWTQNDKPGEDWQRKICESAKCLVKRVKIPVPHKDLNDWTRAGATTEDLVAAMVSAEVIREAVTIAVVETSQATTEAVEPGLFPLDALNAVMREIAKQSADVYQIKCELPAMAGVAVMAGAIGKEVVVQGAVSGRDTHCNLYVIPGAPKSYGKNAAASMAAPLRDASNEIAKSFRETERPTLLTEKKVSEKREQGLVKNCADDKTAESERQEKQVELAKIQKRLDEIESLLTWPPTYLVGNATSAALTEILKRNGETIFSFSPEAGELVRIALGKFTKDKAADFDLFLSGYTVESARETRISRGDSGDFVPCISVLWFCQPFLLRELFTNEEALERGLTARVLPFIVEHEGNIPEDDGIVRCVTDSAR